MRIAELFTPECMRMDLCAQGKWEAIEELAGMLFDSGRISSVEDYVEAVREREAQISTGVGMGIGIPHGRCAAVQIPSIAFGRSRRGIEFDAIDEEPVALVFLLAVPSSLPDREYMQTLARLARLLVHESFREKLLAASATQDVLTAIEESEGPAEEGIAS